jgi:signal peptidase II
VKPRHLYLIALVVVILDQASKLAVTMRLPLGSSIPVIGDVVYFTSVQNSGGAFGSFQSATGLLMLVTVATVIGIAILVKRTPVLSMPMGLALALALGGALGNLIDRLRFHHVIDFIDLRVWPVFNLADSAITVGIIFLGYHLLFSERPSAAAAGEAEK